MTALIQRALFGNKNKNMSAPQIFIILLFYTVVTSAYTGVFFGTRALFVRFGISVFIVVAYVAVERGPISKAAAAIAAPLVMYGALTFGAVYFKGDFLIFTYACCIAMISLTYLNPRALLIYIIASGAASAVILFVLRLNLLGPAFSDVYNILYFVVSIGLNCLVYIFCRFTVQSLRELTEAKNEANAANQAKSAFLSTMSHEIRTPLNAILGITEILLEKDPLDPQEKEALYKVYTSGDLLLGIINDILDLSKIEAGKLELITSEYEVASLINDTAQLNAMRIGRKPIQFTLSVDERLPSYLLGDELRVKQILNNLLSNAFKYTDAGDVKLSMSAQDETALRIVVSDTGQGMTREQVGSLFDEYSRFNTAANRTTEGTGLGMSITRNLIQMMNGTISVESEPGQGSVFTVTLPQGRVGDGVLGREVAENLQRFHVNSMSHMEKLHVERSYMPYGSVLIVDDVETNIYVARGFLAPYGLKADSADSGFAAVDKVKSGNVYDVIFMDHMMPGMDGMEAAGQIRALGYAHPIVALTANAVAGQADVFLGNGFDGFISKPIVIPQLNDVLNKFIRDKQTPEVLEAARLEAEANQKEHTPAPEVDAIFAEVFSRDAKKSLAVLDGILAKGGAYTEEDLRAYVIHVHGMKSALANIGEAELSAVALRLEQSGREGLKDVVTADTPAFLTALRAVVEQLKPKEGPAGGPPADRAYLLVQLTAVKQACEDYDIETAGGVIKDLQQKQWAPQDKELLSAVAEALLHSEFDEAVKLIGSL